MEILKPTLQHIHKLVVSIGIGRPEKKPLLQHKILGIADNSFDHLAVIEIDPHPQTRNNRRMFMKMKGPVPQIPIEGLYKENCLGILRRNRLDLLGIHELKSN
jgi:hypothetical protein